MAHYKSKLSIVPPTPPSAAAALHHGGPVRAWPAVPEMDQIAILHELVLTQSASLARKHPEILGIGLGRRTKGHPSLRSVHPENCLSILVKKKWDSDFLLSNHLDKAFPKVLWTTHARGTEELCCPVPVDVEDLSYHANVKLHNVPLRVESEEENAFVNGSICCAVSWSARPGAIYLLSCHHVLCMSDVYPAIPPDVEVFNLYTRAPIGDRPQFFGFPDNDGFFLDAALVELKDPSSSSSLDITPVGGVYASTINELAHSAVIQTNTQNVPVSFVKAWYGVTDLLPYPWVNTTQKWVIEMQFESPDQITWRGDSGSPVFNQEGTIWQGMHIAGDDKRAYMLPAFELLRAAHYGMSTEEEDLLIPL